MFMAEHIFMIGQVAEQIELAISTVERAVAALKKANMLHFSGPRNKGYWEVL